MVRYIFAFECLLPRIANAILRPKTKLPISRYLRKNFYFTTSGNFRTRALIDVMMEVGANRVLYSVDYTFEDMPEGGRLVDQAAISEQSSMPSFTALPKRASD